MQHKALRAAEQDLRGLIMRKRFGASWLLLAVLAAACGGAGGDTSPTKYTLTVLKAGTGSGTVSGEGIDCGAACTTSVASGTVVTLAATPNGPSTFGSWSGCDSWDGTNCIVTMNTDRQVTATFNLGTTSHTLSVQEQGSGSGTVSGGGINCGATCSTSVVAGTVVTLTATPNPPSTFGGWSGCDSTNGTSCTVTMDADRQVTATFNPGTGSHTLTVQKQGSGSGTVTGGGIDCGATCTASVEAGTVVTLTASPVAPSTFGSWSGCDSTNGTSCTVTMTADRQVIATFNPATSYHTLTVQKLGSGSGTVKGGGIDCGATCTALLAQGTVVTLTAIPTPPSTFDSWSGCDSTDGSSCTVTLNAERQVTATFGPGTASPMLTVQKQGSGFGTVRGGGIDCGTACNALEAPGTLVTLVALPDPCSRFVAWEGCDSASGTTCDVTVNVSRAVIATFNATNDSGPWVATANMGVSRSGHAATLLPYGNVLVAGGTQPSFVPRPDALYDPATGTWSPTGSMKFRRSGLTMALLQTGKVLGAGGVTGGGEGFPGFPLPAELYDPATGTWSQTGSLASPRSGHTMTVLLTGKVLVVGGSLHGGSTSAELYDPATGEWHATGALSTGRSSHTATLLPSGKVLVLGGRISTGAESTASAELYDPATGTWTPGAPMLIARFSHTAVLLHSGTVLVSGGVDPPGGAMDEAELYDPVTGTWHRTGSLVTPHERHSATLLSSGRVLVVGGYDVLGIAQHAAEVFDPASETWSNAGCTLQARVGHTATLLPSGEILVAGGSGASGTAELYTAEGRASVWSQPDTAGRREISCNLTRGF